MKERHYFDVALFMIEKCNKIIYNKIVITFLCRCCVF